MRGEVIMADYRCYMFNVEGEILFGVNIAAETPDAASRRAIEILRTKNRNRSPSRLICAFEVWSGSDRLFPQRLGAMPTVGQIAGPRLATTPIMPLPRDFTRGSVPPIATF
jgi:hypothetical protein